MFRKKRKNAIALIAASASSRAIVSPKKLAHVVLAETSAIAFISFSLLTMVVFIRPADLFPETMAEFPIFKVLSVTTLAACAPQLMARLNLYELRKQPILFCFLLYFAACLFSQLTHIFFWWVREAAVVFTLMTIYLMAMMTIVDTPARLHRYLKILAGSATVFVVICMLDFNGYIDFVLIKKLRQATEMVDAAGNRVYTYRMQGAGLFLDPNDLSQLVVMSGVIYAYLFSIKESGSTRLLWLIPLLIQLPALQMTQSRGGLLAFGAAGVTVVAIYYGRKACIAAAVAGVVGMAVLGGRQASVDLSGSTGGARLLLWREGFVAMTGKDAIFGIGYGMYEEVAGLLAHNSFVQAYVETGLVGGTMFFGIFFFAMLSLIRMKKEMLEHLPPELRRFHPYCAALVVGYCVGMFSLSRNYVLPTYMIVGVSAVYVNLVCIRLKPPRLLAYVDWPHAYKLIGGSACCFLFFYLMVRIIAR